MKISLVTYPLLACLILTASCKKETPASEKEKTTKRTSDTLTSVKEASQLKKAILKETDNAFVTSTNGSLLYEEASIDKKAIGNLPHGTAIQLIKIVNDYALVNAYIIRVNMKDGKKYESRNWEDVYTPLVNLGNRSEMQISADRLYDVLDYENGEDAIPKMTTSRLKKHLSIELVTEHTFLEALKNKTSDFIDHKAIAKKENGILTITGGKQPLIIKDNLNVESDYFNKNTYTGYIPLLNAYLVDRSLYEGEISILYNKETSQEIINFYGFPFISPSKTQMITLEFNPYENATEIEIFKIVNGAISSIDNGADYLTGFSPYYDQDEKKITRFWSNDNAYYLKAIHPNVSTDNGTAYNSPVVPQYIKIRFK